MVALANKETVVDLRVQKSTLLHSGSAHHARLDNAAECIAQSLTRHAHPRVKSPQGGLSFFCTE